MNVIKIEGAALTALLHSLDLAGDTGPIYRLRVALDDGDVKFKVNEYTWSPPYDGGDQS